MSKARSINYPFIPLKKALLRVEQIDKKEGKNPVAPDIAAEHWEYSPASSGVRQTIAALKSFGLIEVSGDKNIQISESALHIILDKRKDSTERDNFIKTAATKPKIFNEMWEKWGQSRLPSDENMEYFLIFEKKINKVSASKIIKIFKETISFANLEVQIPEEDNEAEDNENSVEDIIENKDSQTNLLPETQTQQTEIRRDTCSLDEGQAIIQFPEEMSKSSYLDFVDWLDLIKNKAKRLAGHEEETN